MSERGLVHIYCGSGKGKTTAAIGLAVRAAGRGRRVLLARFLKTENSGEVEGLAHVPGVKLLPCKRSFGFTWEMTAAGKQEAALYYSGYFSAAWEMALGSDPEDAYDMLILDEIIAACNQGFVDEAYLVECLKDRPARLEVVLTGREPSAALAACADYITEMAARRHPYEKGIAAREGIEY